MCHSGKGTGDWMGLSFSFISGHVDDYLFTVVTWYYSRVSYPISNNTSGNLLYEKMEGFMVCTSLLLSVLIGHKLFSLSFCYHQSMEYGGGTPVLLVPGIKTSDKESDGLNPVVNMKGFEGRWEMG